MMVSLSVRSRAAWLHGPVAGSFRRLCDFENYAFDVPRRECCENSRLLLPGHENDWRLLGNRREGHEILQFGYCNRNKRANSVHF
jgi:hypothetical protein